MTPKEKAQELIKKMGDEAKRFYTWEVKACALIAVDEIIRELNENFDTLYSFERVEYWQKVKQEIENL